MMERIKQIKSELDKINDERRYWLMASSFVFVSVIFYIVVWPWLQGFDSALLDWAFISAGFIVTINWWYWTMSLVRKYITHQKHVFEILGDIVVDLKTIGEDVKNLNKPVDNKDELL